MNTQRPVPKYFVVLAGIMAAGGLAVLFGLQAESYLSAALTFLFSLPVFCGAFYFPFSQLFFRMKNIVQHIVMALLTIDTSGLKKSSPLVK